MRLKIVGAGSPRPQSVRVGEPNPYEDLVAVARFLNMTPEFLSKTRFLLFDFLT